jgi:hypothetical protein
VQSPEAQATFLGNLISSLPQLPEGITHFLSPSPRTTSAPWGGNGYATEVLECSADGYRGHDRSSQSTAPQHGKETLMPPPRSDPDPTPPWDGLTPPLTLTERLAFLLFAEALWLVATDTPELLVDLVPAPEGAQP